MVPGSKWLKRIHAHWPLRPVASQYLGETARRYSFLDGSGEIGLINSITESFCGQCSRARVTADGSYYTCLFASQGINLRPFLSYDAEPSALQDCIRAS